MTDQVVQPFRAEIKSDYGPWWRRFVALLAVVNLALMVFVLTAVNDDRDKGKKTRDLLCAIAQDDADNDRAVRFVYHEYCENGKAKETG